MKFVSYNIQYGFGLDGRFDLQRIATSLAGADVIALQEVTRNSPENDHVDMVAALQDLFPDFFMSYGAGCDVLFDFVVENGRRRERRFQFGNMILSRWPILATRHLLLPRTHSSEQLNLQRSAVEAVIDGPGGAIRAYSVHLDHVSPDERIAQIAFLKERVLNFVAEGGSLTGAASRKFPELPLPQDFVVMGDFNMEPETPEYIAMVGHADHFYGRSLRANQPVDVLARFGRLAPDCYSWIEPPEGPQKAHLDYCFINHQLFPRVQDVFVDMDAKGSDHFPVWLEID
ncbi:endonuclease [Rhizobiales bacterium RZME27]|jgi:endonuclease/exonuclease/phosphatase family metal-dependent hydrolase|uniref:Endonuclease n=1 Tax=Endobacterium cereale TaxID=2663029 RepID=A0A6A8A8H8_9HYPH|nr:endonuclease/exonuclease/phosphatase family protein [Endobacterium cereale]MEB2845178.1 endonuclease/exonuclease/phosphatase family protein [Endobacterium cereale]MQY45960.1 endonuclease [Endobacterium cereale]